MCVVWPEHIESGEIVMHNGEVCRMVKPDALMKIYARKPEPFTKHRKDSFAKYVFDVIVASLMRSFD